MPLRYLGTIVSGAGASTTNATTAAPFVIPPMTRLLIQPDAAASVMSGVATAVLGTSVSLVANEKYYTVMNAQNTVVISGQVSGQLAAVGSAAFNARVFEETGDSAS